MGIPCGEILMDGVIWSKNDEDRENLKIYNSRPSKYRYSDDFCGYIYRFKNKSGTIIYVGQTEDLVRRMLTHTHLDAKCYESICIIEYFKVDYFLDINKVEESLIKEYAPKFNDRHNRGWKKRDKYIPFNADIEWCLLEKCFYPVICRRNYKAQQEELKLLEEQREKLRAESRSIKRLNLGVYKSPYSSDKIRRFKGFRYYETEFLPEFKYVDQWREVVNSKLVESNISTELTFEDYHTEEYKIMKSIERNTYIDNIGSIPITLCSKLHKSTTLIQSAVVYKLNGITKTGKFKKRDVSFYRYSKSSGGLSESLYVELDKKIATVYLFIDFSGNYRYILSFVNDKYCAASYDKHYREITKEEAIKICSSEDYLKERC